MRSRADLESVHRFCRRNRDLLAVSDRAGCFSCRTIFSPAEVREWVDGQTPMTEDVDDDADGVTALCPRCGIDAVLPSAAPISLSPELLAEMDRHFF